MPRIGYYAILQELQAILQGDPSLNGVTVNIEQEGMLNVTAPWVNLLLDRRDAPPDQYLAGNTKQRYFVKFILNCVQFALNKAEASRLRDELVGTVEIVLMGNRTLNSFVTTSWLEGGAFDITSVDAGFVANAEIMLTADVTATTT